MDATVNRDDVARMRPLERKALLDEIAAMVAAGELQIGDAARILRSGVLGLGRQAFAQVVKLSERAVAKLEDDPHANPTLDTLKRVFAPFGGAVTLVFPQVEDAESLGEDRRQRRAAIQGALAKSRRRRIRPKR
ncbi:helix-turn-helix domain-containing protein [Corallococcus coralloides]|uniref:helix-turn-helix domain-containing protein n=1 Tax=Corallococcus coralloides TaxID=184914 RepID=UPI00384CBF72